jgi:hypothetical protein
MLFLITINFRQGATHKEGQAAARLLQERLMSPNPGVKIINAVADIGGGEIHLIADLTEQVMANIRRTLEFRALSAVERIEYTPVVDAKEALDVYLEMDLVPRDI